MRSKYIKKTSKKISTMGVKQPLVSVILPAYNAEKYITKAIESIVNQTYKNWELVIVDDASTDRTWQIISSFKKFLPKKIKTIRIKKNINRGGDGAGAEAFKHISPDSEFIARMDADDISYPKRLDRQVRYMIRNPNCDVLGSSAKIIDGGGKIVGKKDVKLNHSDIYQKYFVLHPMIHPSLIIRRTALLGKKTLYLLDQYSNNDYLTFATMICKGRKFANIKEPLIKYRVHGLNDSLVQIKATFVRTLKTRWKMVSKLGYKLSFISALKLFFQIVVVSFLPEKIILFLYLYSRGIYTLSKTFFSPLKQWLKNVTLLPRVAKV